MDPETRRIYEDQAEAWIGLRRARAVEDGRVARFAARVQPGGRVADLGSGPGWYASELARLGHPALALDVSLAMLRAGREREPGLPSVCADLAALPVARGALSGAFAINCYSHLPCAQLPVALAHLHACLAPGAAVELTLTKLEDPAVPAGERDIRSDHEFAGRLFSAFSEARARELLAAAGFGAIECDTGQFWHELRAIRELTLPDFVRPGLRLLVCGLNPSLYSAEHGIPFGRPGNRFWPAAAAAGLPGGGQPFRALAGGLGFTDLAKRATARASDLDASEYRDGRTRLESLVRRYQPRAVCFVGLEGFRHAVDRRAAAGPIEGGFAGRPAYLMPSTSGLNAHARLPDLTEHLRRAAAI